MQSERMWIPLELVPVLARGMAVFIRILLLDLKWERGM
jgi:hypothetical protein